jgi:hypothetical protein
VHDWRLLGCWIGSLELKGPGSPPALVIAAMAGELIVPPHNLASMPQRIGRGRLIPYRQVPDGDGLAIIDEVSARFVKK